MTRQFRRTEEQFRASVRGLNLSPDYEAPDPPPAPPASAEVAPAPETAEAPGAAAAAAPAAPGKTPKVRRLRGRNARSGAPSVERIIVPREGGPTRTRVPAAYQQAQQMGTVGDETQAIEAARAPEETEVAPAQPTPTAWESINTSEMVAIQSALSAPEASEAPEVATVPGAPEAEVSKAEAAEDVDGLPAVSVHEGVKIYGSGANAVRAIDQVTHGFPKGRFTAIMGPSGSGKSTLLHCLAALDDLSSGKVFIGKVDVTTLDEKAKTQLRRDKVGFIFQSYNLVPTLTAIENITLPMELAKREPDQKWINYLVQTIGLADRLDHLPSELSGGQAQRVAAARALAAKPEIVFADEPTGNLDSRRSLEILQFLRVAVDEFRQTIVMVTHDPVAASFADSVVFLADGRIVTEMTEPTVEKVLDQIKVLETLET